MGKKSGNNFGEPGMNMLFCGSLSAPAAPGVSEPLFFSHKQQLMSSIDERVKKIIVDKLGVDESDVTTDASFTTDLGADSLDTVELIMEFEKEFDINIPDEQAEQIQTVGQAIKYLQENS